VQTLTLDIQDNFMQDFQNIIEKYKDKITIKKDLEQIIEESENGTMELLSQEQYDKEMDVFFKDLKANENI